MRNGCCIARRIIYRRIKYEVTSEKGVDDREIEKVTKALKHQERQHREEAVIELCNLCS